MKVYIDLIILFNFIFDLILLLSVNYILRRNARKIRIILGSLIGEITLLILFINISNILLFGLKFLISILMLVITFSYRDIRYLFKNILYFYLVSMLLGGGIEFLNNQFFYTNNGLVFQDNGIGGSYTAIIVVSLILFYKYLKSLKDLKNNYSNYYKCKLVKESIEIEVNGFLDTGNKLVDPVSKKSIVLVNEEVVKDFNLLLPIYVPYNTLNNHGLLKCYKGFKLEVNNRIVDNFLVGISNERLYLDGIDCILNINVMEG